VNVESIDDIDAPATWKTAIQTAANAAMVALHLDHLIAVADPGSIVANSSLWAKLHSKSATPAYSSYDNQDDSLEAIRDRGDGEWVTATGFAVQGDEMNLVDGAITADKIASAALTAAKFASGAFDAVWSVATRVLTAGTNIVLAKGTGITGFNDLSAAQVNAEADQALTDYDAPTKAELDSAQSAIITALHNQVKKNAALASFPFVMFDEDGNPATGKTVTAERSLDGAAFAGCANSPSEISAGAYKISLAASDLNADTVLLKFTATDCKTTFVQIVTQATS
jgi:hypothetical protein